VIPLMSLDIIRSVQTKQDATILAFLLLLLANCLARVRGFDMTFHVLRYGLTDLTTTVSLGAANGKEVVADMSAGFH
jgi:hypothetical protein